MSSPLYAITQQIFFRTRNYLFNAIFDKTPNLLMGENINDIRDHLYTNDFNSFIHSNYNSEELQLLFETEYDPFDSGLIEFAFNQLSLNPHNSDNQYRVYIIFANYIARLESSGQQQRIGEIFQTYAVYLDSLLQTNQSDANLVNIVNLFVTHGLLSGPPRSILHEDDETISEDNSEERTAIPNTIGDGGRGLDEEQRQQRMTLLSRSTQISSNPNDLNKRRLMYALNTRDDDQIDDVLAQIDDDNLNQVIQLVTDEIDNDQIQQLNQRVQSMQPFRNQCNNLIDEVTLESVNKIQDLIYINYPNSNKSTCASRQDIIHQFTPNPNDNLYYYVLNPDPGVSVTEIQLDGTGGIPDRSHLVRKVGNEFWLYSELSLSRLQNTVNTHFNMRVVREDQRIGRIINHDVPDDIVSALHGQAPGVTVYMINPEGLFTPLLPNQKQGSYKRVRRGIGIKKPASRRRLR